MTRASSLGGSGDGAPAIDWTPAPDVVGAYRVGHSKPNGHPADGMNAIVDMGGGAMMTIPNPQSYATGGLEWTMRYGDCQAIRFTVASAISSYDYLLSGAIPMKEATRRLRLLRAAYRHLAQQDASNEA